MAKLGSQSWKFALNEAKNCERKVTVRPQNVVI